MDKHHHVCILLDGTRFSEVTQLWAFSFNALTGFRSLSCPALLLSAERLPQKSRYVHHNTVSKIDGQEKRASKRVDWLT